MLLCRNFANCPALKMKKLLLILSFLPLLFFTQTALADVICQPVYGGGQTCITTGNILITKKVQNPQTGQFVNNLTVNDPKFSPGNTVTFKIFLQNTGGTTILQTKISDVIPSFTTFVSGPGIFDSNSRNLTFTVDNLTPGETREVATIQVNVMDAKGLPDGVNCEPKNIAVATTNTGQTSQATSSFCIEKKVVTTKGGLPIVSPSPMPTTPPTGPEMLPLMALLPGGLAGFFLRRRAKKI